MELVKFLLDELYVLSAPKFYVATPKIISKYFGFFLYQILPMRKSKYREADLNVVQKILGKARRIVCRRLKISNSFKDARETIFIFLFLAALTLAPLTAPR